MSNIIDKIQVSGVTYDIQGSGGGGITVDPTLDSGSTNPVANSAITTALDAKVNVADNAVSTKTIMYTYDAGDTAWKYPYNQGLRINQFFVKYTQSFESSNVPAWNSPMYITNGSTTSQINLRVNASNYQITSVASTSGDFTYALEGGQVNVTLPSGYYISSFAQKYSFQILYPKYVINGGQSAQALQNTENVLNDIYSEMPKRFITGGSISCSSTNINSYLYDNNNNSNNSSIQLGTSIKGDSNTLDVYFDGQTIHQKILNTGSSNYCDVPNNVNFDYVSNLDEVTLFFNSAYTGSNTNYTIKVNVINSSYNEYTDYLYYDVANHTLDASSANYVTATTVGDDYTYLIKPKQEYSNYRIVRIRENNRCNIAGIDNQWKEGYIITGVTTPSYSYQAQEIIDDLYSKVGSGITSGEVQTMIDESISGKADTNNTVQSVGLSTLADGKSITAVIPSGTTYTSTIFKVGNGLTWQPYNSTIVVDTSKIAQKTDIPTVSSAITSGDTNAVAGGAVYDKFDEVEQVTAAALNVLNESLSGKASQSDLVTVSASTAANTTALGGLSLVKLTQTQYDNLQTKDPSTLYVIVD